jgi:phage protein D
MSTGRSLLTLDQDFYVPYFEVILVNRKLGKEVIRDITQISYKDDIELVDSFQITISNWDAQRRAFKYSDIDMFLPGKELELWMGYYGKDSLSLMIKGSITALQPTCPASGNPTLAITGQNLLHRLRDTQRTHTYKDMTDSAIAREVGRRIGVQMKTNDEAERKEERHKYIIQEREYDIVFLMKRARRMGYDLYVEERGQKLKSQDSVLYFGPTVISRQSGFKLGYGTSLIDFTPTLNTSNQVGSVEVNGWDSLNKTTFKSTVRREQISRRGVDPAGGRDQIEQGFRNRREVIATRPVNSPQEGMTLATETHENIAKEMLTCSGSTIGLPGLRAGTFVYIEGVGTRFSGRYFVKSTTHAISDGGYTTRFDGRRE